MSGLVFTTDAPVDTPAAQPTVTLLLTDIEGSTQLVHGLGELYPGVVLRCRELQKQATARHGGEEVDSPGDALLAAFAHGRDAVRAAIDILHAFHSEPWPQQASVRVRIGIHTGHPSIVDHSYFGLDVHRTARISASAAGGQVVFSTSTREQLGEEDLPSGVRIRDLGSHRLKDLRYPETLFDLEVPGLPVAVSSLRSLDSQPNNLPVSSTTFVGRARQLDEVRTRLRRPAVRLLTLTGAGGTGKTRLALEAAHGVLDEFPHGVFAVHLAPVSDPELFASAIVHTLGVSQFASKTPLEILKHHLAPRQTLLVLDNFEQIIDAATDVVDLLSVCPLLKVLITSRESLNVRLEHEYVVSPLQIPSRNTRFVSSLAAFESVQLLVERAQTHDQTFALTPDNADALSSICIRLDGLPLALELAASWLKLFSPRELLARLTDSIDLLTGGPRDLAAHQQTLKGTIAWSYDLLTPSDQMLFRRLAVFSGGCTIASAAATVTDAGRLGELMDGLHSLTRKNLITSTTIEGEKRLGMLETIRQFAQQRLEETAEFGDAQRRHAEHYLLLAERLAPGLMGRQQRRFVTPLLAELDNLRAALNWAIEQEDAEITSRLLTAMVWLWIPRGHFTEGRSWAEKARQRFAGHGATREWGMIVEAVAWLEAMSGNYLNAGPSFEQAADIFETLADPVDRIRVKAAFAVTCVALGSQDRGTALSDDAVALSRSIEHRSTTAIALLSAGAKHEGNGDAAGAFLWYERAMHAFYDADNVFWPGGLLQNLARLRLLEGDWRRAAELASDALTIGREYHYPMIRNISLAVMAGVAVAKGTPVVAAQLCGVIASSLGDLGVTFEPPEQEAMDATVQAATEELGDERFGAACEQGRCWNEAQVAAAVACLADPEPVAIGAEERV